MKYRRFGTFLLVALLSVTLLAPGNRSVPPASAQGQAQREPLDYFREMMPVFTHDRCINCHGEVDPFTNRDHEGGQIEPDSTRSCTKSGCHSQANNTDQDRNNDWRVAPAAVLFVKPAGSGFVRKDEKELCEQMADRVANLGATEFRHHLKDDIPIELGFQGMSAGARDGPPARPTMPKAEFLRVADAWLNDGFGVCEREGTIIRTEDIKSDTTYAPTDPEGQGHEVRVQQSGRRVVNIRFANGRFETNVTVSGAVINTQTIRGVLPNGDSCTTIITGTLRYSQVDDPGPGSAPGITGTAGVNVKFESDGRYTVYVQLGEEKHRSMESTVLQNGCPSPIQAPPPETIENVWSPSRFLFRGKLIDPRDRTRLGGRELRMWFERAESSDEDPWLPDHYAVMMLNGKAHPVEIKTYWNIRYRPR